MDESIDTRKEQHIDLCAHQDVEASERSTCFDRLNFRPSSLPELDWDELDIRAELCERIFSAPFVISGMTFGTERSEAINLNLARCAAHHDIPMGVGSQRIALDGKYRSNLRKHAPDVFLIANLGISHLQRHLCLQAVKMIEANAIAIHLNVMQELIQPEGSRNFHGILQSLIKLAANFPVPIIVKEVGFGLDVHTAMRLYDRGVKIFDIGGKGGTSWSWVEGLRGTDPETRQLGEVFRDWGIPTAYNIGAMRYALPRCTLIATGGVRDGLMAAKALALKANFVGIGLPLLKAALVSDTEAIKVVDAFVRGLKITMMTTGSSNLDQLSDHIDEELPYQYRFNRFMRHL